MFLADPRHNTIASRTFARVSSREFPSDTQPGRAAEQIAEKPPPTSGARMTVNFMTNDTAVRVRRAKPPLASILRYNVLYSGRRRSGTAERWEVHDRYGNKIYMTAERWLHAVQRRPWLADCHYEALETVRRGRRKQDPLNPRKYKYYRVCERLLPDFNHLVIVVVFEERTDESGQRVPNNYVTTVWAVFIYGRR